MAKRTKRDRTTESDREIVRIISQIILVSFRLGGDVFHLPASLGTLSNFYIKNVEHTLKMDDADWSKFKWKDYSPMAVESLTRELAILLERVLALTELVNQYRIGVGKPNANFMALAIEIARQNKGKKDVS